MSHPDFFATSKPWKIERPHILVVACSDGRIQEQVDEFLNEMLGISFYDRLYLPGGPGALSPITVEFLRASRMTDELKFLVKAHEIEEVILLYHGPAHDGPNESICADYSRIYSSFTAEQIRKQQERDTEEILKGPLRGFPSGKVHAYRLEVTGALGIDVVRIV